MERKREHVLITGAEGALGQELAKACWDAGWTVTGLSRKDCDITDRDAVFSAARRLRPTVIMNAAAYNAVDKAETDDAEFALAMAVNGRAPGYLAEAAKEVGAAMVHFSTDYVFSGTKDGDYTEDDPTDPVNRYGESKAAGERAVAAAGGRWYVCRMARLFGRMGISEDVKPTFASVMLNAAATKPEIKVVHEEPGMPTFTRDAAEAAVRLVRDAKPSGIYHLINEGPAVTWFEFAEEIFSLSPVSVPRIPVAGDAFGARPAKRPGRARLISTKIAMLRPRLKALAAFLHAPKISLVIVTHNCERLIAENLTRLFELGCTYPFDIIAVDNGSKDGTPRVIREQFPQVRLIQNAYNSGFAHACNQGAAVAHGDVVIFFNPDMKLNVGTLERTYETLRDRKEVGIMGVKLVTETGELVQSVRRDPGFIDQLAILLKIPHLFPSVMHRYLAKDMDHHRSGSVDSVRGSYFAMRRDVLNAVGLFDETNFFIWFEEVDLCKRVRAAGYQVWYEAEVTCLDHVGATFSTKPGTQKQIWFSASMVKYFRKWHPPWQYAILAAVRPFAIAASFVAEKARFKRAKHIT